MNSHLKFLLKGILILLLMTVYWLLGTSITVLFPEFYENYSVQIFYIQILFSFFFYFLLLFYFFNKSNPKNIKVILLQGIPFIFIFLLMQFAQINIPRLLDIFILLIGVFIIFFSFMKLKNNTQRIITLFLFCLLLIPIYPFAYNNVWYYCNKKEMNAVRELGEFNLSITDLSGKVTELSNLNGKTVLIDMWSSSCGNCIASMPDFEKLNLEFKQNKDYKIISLFCPVKKEQTYDWFKDYIGRKFKFDIDYYYIEYETFQKLSIRKFPEFLIVNKSSKLLYRGQISYLPYVSDNIYSKLKSINENY